MSPFSPMDNCTCLQGSYEAWSIMCILVTYILITASQFIIKHILVFSFLCPECHSARGQNKKVELVDVKNKFQII